MSPVIDGLTGVTGKHRLLEAPCLSIRAARPQGTVRSPGQTVPSHAGMMTDLKQWGTKSLPKSEENEFKEFIHGAYKCYKQRTVCFHPVRLY